MKKLLAVFAFSMSVFLFSASAAFADVSTQVAFQGRLTDASGFPVSTTSPANFSFKIYDTATGNATMTFPTISSTSAIITNGIYAVTLDFTNFTAAQMDRPLYLEVTISGLPSPLPSSITLARTQITVSPYALNVRNGAITGAKLAAGTATNGYFLKTDGTNISWAAVSGTFPTPGNPGDNYKYLMANAGGTSWTNPAGTGLTNTNGTLSVTYPLPSSGGTVGQYLRATGSGVQWASFGTGLNDNGTSVVVTNPLPAVSGTNRYLGANGTTPTWYTIESAVNTSTSPISSNAVNTALSNKQNIISGTAGYIVTYTSTSGTLGSLSIGGGLTNNGTTLSVINPVPSLVSGQFLTNNGTTLSWAVPTFTLPTINLTSATGQDVNIGGNTNSVTSAINPNAVTTTKIADHAVTGVKLYPSLPATNGQYLTSDTGGNLSWAAPTFVPPAITLSSASNQDVSVSGSTGAVNASIVDGKVTKAKLSPGTSGTSGQYLMYDSSTVGNLSWATPTVTIPAITLSSASSQDVSVSGSTGAVNASIVDGKVTTSKIADLNVTTAKIADSAVTLKKLSAGTASPGQFLTTANGTDLSWGAAQAPLTSSSVITVGTITASSGTITNLYATTINGAPADLAEIYPSSDNLSPGDVVIISQTKDGYIEKSKTANDTKVAGVVSTKPGIVLNSEAAGYQLALVGKVPVNVTNEGGDIKRGDLLVASSTPGCAMKAPSDPKAGTIIGKALENSSGPKGKILALVNLQ
ncbi:MAG: hypothetical protein FWC57_03950 [Endomicrobia bacterium]|nr:hypothetical protein [Endomicrobiia bacterium]